MAEFSTPGDSKSARIEAITANLHFNGTSLRHLVQRWDTKRSNFPRPSALPVASSFLIADTVARVLLETHFSRSTRELVRKPAIDTGRARCFFVRAAFCEQLGRPVGTWVLGKRRHSDKLSVRFSQVGR